MFYLLLVKIVWVHGCPRRRWLRRSRSAACFGNFAASLLAFLAARTSSGAGAFDDPEDLILAHDQQLLAVDLDFRAAVFAEEHPITGLNIQGLARAVFLVFAKTDGNNLALCGFSLAESGMMMPPRICSPSSMRLTITRSCSGVIFVFIKLLVVSCSGGSYEFERESNGAKLRRIACLAQPHWLPGS